MSERLSRKASAVSEKPPMRASRPTLNFRLFSAWAFSFGTNIGTSVLCQDGLEAPV